MPRPLRHLLEGFPVHILQRGHNRSPCFAGDGDCILYLGLLQEFSKRHGCRVHAYVLMSNHVHLLVSAPSPSLLSNLMRDINQVFVQHVNRHQGRCGSAWQGRPKMCVVDSSSYFLNCQSYIELNPVRARMVEQPLLYPWSSYATNAHGRASTLVTPHPTYLGLGGTASERERAYREFVDVPMTPELLAKIRTSVNSGWPLGDDAFVRHVEETLGIKARPGQPGRPKTENRGQTRV